MRAWVDDALELLAREPRIALVSVAGVAGSAPREPGAKMVVTAAGARGTIGGGALEHTCIAQARAMLSGAIEHARAQDYPLGPLLGQCCGGRVKIALDVLTVADRTWLSDAAAFEARGVEYRLSLPINGERSAAAGWQAGADEPCVVLWDQAGGTVNGQSQNKWDVRVEYVRPQPRRVLLVGGGHVGAAVARLLGTLPLQVSWIDPRESDNGGALFCADTVGAVETAEPDTVFLIMTHSHALDFDLTAAMLRREDALYCGVIGSETKRRRFLSRLRNAGLSEDQCGRLVCPIGSVGLSSKEPAIIALAVATEIMLRFEAHEQPA